MSAATDPPLLPASLLRARMHVVLYRSSPAVLPSPDETPLLTSPSCACACGLVRPYTRDLARCVWQVSPEPAPTQHSGLYSSFSGKGVAGWGRPHKTSSRTPAATSRAASKAGGNHTTQQATDKATGGKNSMQSKAAVAGAGAGGAAGVGGETRAVVAAVGTAAAAHSGQSFDAWAMLGALQAACKLRSDLSFADTADSAAAQMRLSDEICAALATLPVEAQVAALYVMHPGAIAAGAAGGAGASLPPDTAAAAAPTRVPKGGLNGGGGGGARRGSVVGRLLNAIVGSASPQSSFSKGSRASFGARASARRVSESDECDDADENDADADADADSASPHASSMPAAHPSPPSSPPRRRASLVGRLRGGRRTSNGGATTGSASKYTAKEGGVPPAAQAEETAQAVQAAQAAQEPTPQPTQSMQAAEAAIPSLSPPRAAHPLEALGGQRAALAAINGGDNKATDDTSPLPQPPNARAHGQSNAATNAATNVANMGSPASPARGGMVDVERIVAGGRIRLAPLVSPPA